MHCTNEVAGSICAPRGFRASGVAAGIKYSDRPDVALIYSDVAASAAGVFTTNLVRAAPVTVSMRHLADGRARAIVVNSGCANAVTGEQGLRDAERMATIAGAALGLSAEDVVVASTGVIGRHLPMARLEAGIHAAAGALGSEGGAMAARAIMTTDTRPKEYAVEVSVDGRPFRIGGICKGSGMIAPNMATMLAFLTTDAEVWPEVLRAGLRTVTEQTFNCVTIDGDCSTNDTVVVLANGMSGVRVHAGSPGYRAFLDGLAEVCTYLARELARDGEGATHLVSVHVTGARSVAQARQVARCIAQSPLVKTAIFGRDPNWGRILCAAGYSRVPLDPNRLGLRLCGVPLVSEGQPLEMDEPAMRAAMAASEISIELDLGQGRQGTTFWTCDFSYDYVRINAEYTT